MRRTFAVAAFGNCGMPLPLSSWGFAISRIYACLLSGLETRRQGVRGQRTAWRYCACSHPALCCWEISSALYLEHFLVSLILVFLWFGEQVIPGSAQGAILPRPCNVTQPNDRALQAKFFVHCGGIHHTANNTMTLICCSGTPTLLGLQENDYFYNMQLFRTMRLIMQVSIGLLRALMLS